jgi:cytochrome b
MKMFSGNVTALMALLTEKALCICAKLHLVLFSLLYYNYIVHLSARFPMGQLSRRTYTVRHLGGIYHENQKHRFRSSRLRCCRSSIRNACFR